MTGAITHGLSPQQVTELASAVQRRAVELGALAAVIDHQVATSLWQGADGMSFSTEWRGSLRPQLDRMRVTFESLGEQLCRQAEQQVAASA